MKKYSNYIIAVVVLILGVSIGWFIKPTPSAIAEVDHSSHNMETVAGDMAEEIWTCSMHPQIRQNEPGACPICGMDLIPLDNSMSNDDPKVLQMSLAATKLAQIETTVVGNGKALANSNAGIRVEGSIELDERSIKSQATHIGGRVEQMLITFEGEYVKAGQKIGTIYSTDILAASQELLTAAQFDNTIKGLKDASIQKLKNWKISDAQIDQILKTGKPIETVDIFADQSGYVLDKKVSQGDYVRPGQALYTTGNTGRLWLIFNVFESDLGNIRKGQKVQFTTPALGDVKLSARITYIDPLLNSQSRTGVVRAEINNKNNRLKPGMLITGTIDASSATKSSSSEIRIPKSAVLWTGDKSVVYVQLEDLEIPSFEFREVVIGGRSGDQVIIKEGLALGDRVVTNGAFSIDAAAQLSNKQSMMNRDITIKTNAAPDQLPDYVEQTPDAFKDQLGKVSDNYLLLKDALVETDAAKAAMEVKGLLKSVDEVDMMLVKDDAHIYWMEQLDAIKSHGQTIADGTDVEDQRKQFNFLSQAMIKSIKVFGTSSRELYIQYCPMANNNQGADWISGQSEIRNPYFGDKMMKCGSVKDTIQF